MRDQVPLALDELEFPDDQIKAALLPDTEFEQSIEGRGDFTAPRGCAQCRQAPLNAAGGGLETLPLRFQQMGVGQIE